MIWRIRAKSRQPNYVHSGQTDHPDRMGWDPETGTATNGAWLEWEQDEPPYFPGEVSNDPFARSKYALTHIWHEWPGMADVVAEMKAEEERTGVYPRGAGPGAVAEYAAHAAAHPSIMSGEEIPTTPAEATAYWARWGTEHARAQAEQQAEQAKL